MPDRGRCVARGRSHALGRHARERHRQTGAAAREGVLLVCFRGGLHPKMTFDLRIATERDAEHASMLSATTQSHQTLPARASSTGARRCWVDTTPREGPFERYATVPGPVQRLP